MKNTVRFLLLIAFLGFFLLPMVGNTPPATSIGTIAPQDMTSVADLDELTPWWNVNFHYRRMVNLTDSYSTPRIDAPMEVYILFENNTCYKDSIRVIDPNGVEIPSQPYNISYWEDADYIKGATVFWYANVSADSTATYWIYHSEDKTITATNYDAVVSFARTTGTLSGKFSPNYWSFLGNYYNVTMFNSAGGKITNGAHKMDDGSWNWNWGSSAGSMHWNPDGLAGQVTSSTAPITSRTFVNEEGPLFINYTTQLPFGSYAKLNVTYTFYKWGWTTRIYIVYTATVSGSGRTDEWVFYPYITTHSVEVAEDLTQTYYDNWVQSGNKGKPAGFGWWNDNGISHGTVRISHDSWNTNPGYTNNYDSYYYRWNDASAYEYWATAIPTIYAISGTVLEETCAFPVWNGAEGIDGYMRVFNATSRYTPLTTNIGAVSSYSFTISVTDIGNNAIEGANVSLLDAISGDLLYKSAGQPYSELTDFVGSVKFIGLQNKTYTISVWIDTTTWLNADPTATGMNVTWSGDYVAIGPFTPVDITLDLASIDIHLEDLMASNLATIGSETIQVRIYNASDANQANWRYMDYQTTDTNGDLTFTRIPKCDWIFNFSYSDTDTGHIYQWKDFAEYVSYEISDSDITDDLTRNWDLPLVTLDFNVKAY
ncbi:MAG: carboxypeptidase regulatory-like domain-containing protein, partial [Candidatus Thorarchaeota archaeon]